MKVLLLVVILNYFANGFLFLNGGKRNVNLRSLSEKEILSEQDEEILFGSEPPFPGSHRYVSKMGNLLECSNLNPLDYSSSKVVNMLRKTRETFSSCPVIWEELSTICGEELALVDEKYDLKITFKEMYNAVRCSAGIFMELGITKGDHVALLGDNSAYWLILDHGIQLSGGVSVVRGSDAPLEELKYIYDHSDVKNIAVLQGPKLLKKLIKNNKLSLESKYGTVKHVILMHRENISTKEINKLGQELEINIQVLQDLLKTNKPAIQFPSIKREDLSTIVYTSGTTGNPKGVMLTHGNLLHQIGHRLQPTKPYDETEPIIGDKMLSLLPIWHITERTFELWMISRGCTVVYSSIRTFKKDLQKFQPEWLVLVPRVLEKVASGVQDKFNSGSFVVKNLVKFFTAIATNKAKNIKLSRGLIVSSNKPSLLQITKSRTISIALTPFHALGNKLVWSKVKQGFGGRVKTIISGGSALSGSLESFYEDCGIPISVGYGLTECSPLVAHRRIDSNLIVAGCVGQPTFDTELRVVDPSLSPLKNRPSLPNGETGLVLARGPQVMKGYYKNSKATAEAIDFDNWFNTGDLGKINPITNDLILTGREKDTIVLSNGENIEPLSIEDSILSQTQSIDQIILTGQDQKFLTAIVVLNPSDLDKEGFLDKTQSNEILNLQQVMQDPNCSNIEETCSKLKQYTRILQANQQLLAFLQKHVTKATTNFRTWEQVKNIIITLEPFAMANGLLTQSYKVKRNSVMEYYNQY